MSVAGAAVGRRLSTSARSPPPSSTKAISTGAASTSTSRSTSAREGDRTFARRRRDHGAGAGHLPRRAGAALLGVRGRAHRIRPDAGGPDRPGAAADDRVRQQLRQRLVRRAADLPVGSLTAVDSLVVTDTFGVRSLLRPIGDRALPAPHWSMFQLAASPRRQRRRRAAPSRTCSSCRRRSARKLQGAALEEVLFMRDEMANLAWAIERAHRRARSSSALRRDDAGAAGSAADTGGSRRARRRRAALSAGVDRARRTGSRCCRCSCAGAAARSLSRLKRGAVLQPDGSQRVHRARGLLLNLGPAAACCTTKKCRAKACTSPPLRSWRAGSTARPARGSASRKAVGRGEGSSGLRFDRLEPPAGSEPPL